MFVSRSWWHMFGICLMFVVLGVRNGDWRRDEITLMTGRYTVKCVYMCMSQCLDNVNDFCRPICAINAHAI